MTSVKSYYAFLLECSICHQQIEVGNCKGFEEKFSGTRTAYYDPETHRLVGVSEGTGETFECLPCHVILWMNKKAKSEEEPCEPKS